MFEAFFLQVGEHLFLDVGVTNTCEVLGNLGEVELTKLAVVRVT